MAKVWIVNKSYHDFEPAESFGEIKFLSDGLMNRYGVNYMARRFEELLKDSAPDDYMVPCSLNIMNIVAAAILVNKHSRLNLLIFKKGSYVERSISFDKRASDLADK